MTFHSDEFAIARIREAENITMRRLYTQLLNELSKYEATDVPEMYPHPMNELQQVIEDVADQLEEAGLTCIVQVDQFEHAVRNTRTLKQLLAGIQIIGRPR